MIPIVSSWTAIIGAGFFAAHRAATRRGAGPVHGAVEYQECELCRVRRRHPMGPPPPSPSDSCRSTDLHPDPGNPRRIDEEELAALCRSIAAFGLVDPVLARRHDRRVIAGHQRLIAARRCGLTTVPVILLDLSADDARLLNIALNKIGGDWDEDLLAHLLIDLQETAERDLTLSGFGERRFSRPCWPASTSARNGSGPSGSTSTTPWLHDRPGDQRDRPRRRLPARARIASSGATLPMRPLSRSAWSGQPADLAVTDPPYNVSLRRSRRAGHRRPYPAAAERRPAARGMGAASAGPGRLP